MMCNHRACQCARAAELTVLGFLLEAIAVPWKPVPCRRRDLFEAAADVSRLEFTDEDPRRV